MQNSYTFNGFNSIDLMHNADQGSSSLNERRSSLNYYPGQHQSEYPQLISPIFSQSQNFFMSNDFEEQDFRSGMHSETLSQTDGLENSQMLQYIQRPQCVQKVPLVPYNQGGIYTKFPRESHFHNELDITSQPNQQQQQQLLIPPHRSSHLAPKPHELRRNSFCTSILRPVQESRSSSPVLFNRDSVQKQQKYLQIQQKIDNNNRVDAQNNSSPAPRYNRKLSLDSSASAFKSRFRGTSLGSVSSDSTNSITRQLEVGDEKLAKTGNIFQRREDWSIISKLPINKQNTIHIRLEDEGPYGNDETRCFVLSHFSSLGVKKLDCVFCGCELVVYDRFPLIDGTLFVSPFIYSSTKPVPVIVSNKNQFIYGICLKCLSGDDKEHEIKCNFCEQKWSHGSSLQIGTLYKYDIFAATPCCAMRVACKHCKKPLVDLKAGGLPYFSTYSEERQCEFCQTKDFHFIKPLDEIYAKSVCELEQGDDVKLSTGNTT